MYGYEEGGLMSLKPQQVAGCSSDFAKIGECEISFSKNLTLRVYSNTKPSNGKIADLQKGLILVYKGVEMTAEGTGFGVPIIVCGDETYFSGSSSVFMSKRNSSIVIRKEFFMDKVARNTFRNVTLTNRKVRVLLRYIAWLYQKNRRLNRFLSLKSPFLKAGYGTTFTNTASIGTVTVTYDISAGHIQVKAVFKELSKKENIRKIFLLNEQGTTRFRRYVDSNGVEFFDDGIGAWNPIDADWASLTDLKGTIGFRMAKVKGSYLRRGRELLKGSLDWAGLDYELSPGLSVFEYKIEVFEGALPLR
jgi:hypothetical protein